MMNAVRFTKETFNKDFYSYVLVLVCVSCLGLSGCSGLVTANSTNPPPPALTISGVQAATPTPTSFQVDWSTNRSANSVVDYGTSATYGSSTPTNSSLVMNHQIAVTGLGTGTLYHFRVRSMDAGNMSASSADMTFSTARDTTPPTVSITAPAASATISGVTTVSANATDDVAVATVQFKVDNANTGAAVSAAPYNYSLNTTTLSNGNHIITAVATDTSGNAATSTGVAVKVNNASGTVPSISSLNPTSGPVGTSVTIAGANFGAAQGTSTVTFNGVAATATGWSATSIAARVPAGATTGNVVVTVGGVASNGVNFTVSVPTPSITSLNPTSGTVGTSVTIAGANFGAAQGTSTVTFNGVAATATGWSATSIAASVPAGATTGNVVVTVGGVASNGVNFTVQVPAPSISSLNPTSGFVGTSVTINGANFGAAQGANTVKFNGTAATPTSWSATSIAAPVPNGATTGTVVVTAGGVASNGVSFTVQADTTPPTVPAGLTATAISSSQVNLSWTASTDNVGVTGYNVYRGGVKIGTAPSASYQDGGLSASTSYTYNVSAFDAAGNTSAQSASASATTQVSSGGLPTTLGWYQIPNTKMRPVCPPDTAAYPFNSNCPNVLAAWSGGIADTKRNRLLVWGGGHNDYYGNEVYSLDLNSLTMTRLNDPSPLDPSRSCVSTLPDGKANTRHTYGGLSYITHADKMYVFSGIVACTSGGGGNDTWTLNLSDLTWKRQDPTTGAPPPLAIALSYSDYDPNTKNVYVDAVTNFYSYNYDSNTYSSLNGNQGWITPYGSAVVDPDRKLFLVFGPSNGSGSGPFVYDISAGSSYQLQDWTSQTSGCSTLQNANYAGLAYDSVRKVVVGWAGGDTVYLFNPDTKTCTPVTYPNGPGAPQTNGTHGRFRYFPSLGVFAVVNNVDGNAYTLRIDPATPQALSVSNVSTNNVTSTSANVTWTTNNAANSQVLYGTTSSYGSATALDANMVTSHTVSVSGLTAATPYHFQVKSQDSSGGSASSGDVTFTTSPAGNPNPPVLSNVTATNITANSATITWTTDQQANSQVFYGTTTAYGSSSSLDLTLVTSHTVNISGLTAATQYHLQAQSQNAGGVMGTSGDLAFMTGPASPPNPSASDTVTIQETSGATQTNRAVSIPRAFVQGEIPNYAQASIGGTPVLTQCDVKNRWPDGSLKFAIVSLVIPSLPANGTVTIAFSDQSTGNNTGALAQADMLAAPYNFEAQIQESGAASHTVSARTMLSNGSFRYWLQGPIVTAVIIEDRGSARTYDFNTDGGTGNPLHPIFEAWFYPQGNRVEVGYTVENVWAGSTPTNSMRDQTYAFVLVSGQTTPTTHFTQASFNHIGRSRWYRHFWVGNRTPPAIRIDHNLAYMVKTKVIPNYDTSLVLSEALIAGQYNGWGGAPPPIAGDSSGVGSVSKDMDSGGAADTIGLMPTWETMYLLTMGKDDRMLTKTLGNADLVGRIPFHYRESDTNLFFDAGNSTNAFGHIISINARPQENLGIGPGHDYNDTCGGSNTHTLNLGSVSTDGWDSNGLDTSHWPDFGFMAYLISGKYYFMEETEFAGGYIAGWGHGCNGSDRHEAAGVLSQSQAGRGTAWAFRTVTHAWLVAPDSGPEQAYFNDKLQNSIAAFEGERNILLSDTGRQAVWTWASGRGDANGPSPLHFWDKGDPQFIESPMRTDNFLSYAWSPWEESYLFCTFGMARDAGLSNMGDILAWGASRWFHLSLDTTNVNNIYLIGTYRFPTKLASTQNWLTNYADYKNAFLGNGGGLPTSWTYFWPCDYAPDDDKRYEGLATIGFLYPYTADGFRGQDAWNIVNQSMRNTSGCLPADFQSSTYASPKWAILARTP